MRRLNYKMNMCILLLTVMIFIISCNSAKFYGDINLGSNYYYKIDPHYNSIDLSISKRPMESSYGVVKGSVEYVGFDKRYILVISNKPDTNSYWIIDKSQKPEQVGYNENEGRIIWSNVKGPIDSVQFNSLTINMNVNLQPKTFYKNLSHYK